MKKLEVWKKNPDFEENGRGGTAGGAQPRPLVEKPRSARRSDPTSKFNRFNSGGFTLFEILVVTGLVSMIMGTVMYVYQHSMTTYKVTSWKQERLRDVEIFWKTLQKYLEQASDEHDLTTGDMVTIPHSLMFRSVPSGYPEAQRDGHLMKWLAFRLTSSGIPDYKLNCLLSLKGGRIMLEVKPPEGTGPPGETIFPGRVLLQDVTAFVIRATCIRQSKTRGDYLDDGKPTTDEVIGSIVDVSVYFAPPASVQVKNLQLTQNHKFKILVNTSVTNEANFP